MYCIAKTQSDKNDFIHKILISILVLVTDQRSNINKQQNKKKKKTFRYKAIVINQNK